MSLTSKQEAFCNAYVGSGNAADAYRNSYDVKPATKPETVWQQASRLLGNPKVAARVNSLREAAQRRAEWSAADRLSALKGIFDASATDDRRTAIAAIAEANKMQGSYPPTRREFTGRNGGPVQIADITRLKGMTTEELEVLERALIQIGLAESDPAGEGDEED